MINKSIYRTETDSQTQKINLRLPKEKGGGQVRSLALVYTLQYIHAHYYIHTIHIYIHTLLNNTLTYNIHTLMCIHRHFIQTHTHYYIHVCVDVCSVVSDSFVTPQTVAHQAPLSMGFSRQEYCSGLHFLLQGIFSTQGLNLISCVSCIGRQILYHCCHLGRLYARVPCAFCFLPWVSGPFTRKGDIMEGKSINSVVSLPGF